MTVTCTGSDSPEGRFRQVSSRLVEKALLLTAGDGVAQHLRIGEPVEDDAARHAAPRQPEHGLERGIDELALAFGRDDGDHRRQQVEGGLRGRLAGRRRRRRGSDHCGSGGGSFLISRWSAAMSVCLRAIAARISVDAVEVLLEVLLVALALGLAVVELLLHRRELFLLGAAARPRGCGGASLSRARCATGSTRAPPLPPPAAGAAVAGARLGHLDDRDRRALDPLAASFSASLAVIVFL